MLNLRSIFRLGPRLSERDRELVRFVKRITGYRANDPAVYRLAFRHISKVKNGKSAGHESNERLEFLGDAILGSVIAEYLFKKYVHKDEGFLTEMRSKIVNRASLNDIALKLGLDKLLEYDVSGNWFNKSIFGNTLEAFVGALYLDQGYRPTRDFIVQRLLSMYVNLETLAENDTNYKSRLMEFAQKHKMQPVSYLLIGEKADGPHRQFTVAVRIGQEMMGFGTDVKKKFAEQKASEAALARLNALDETR